MSDTSTKGPLAMTVDGLAAIPQAAIEAAARAMAARSVERVVFGKDANGMINKGWIVYADDAKAALVAASPHLAPPSPAPSASMGRVKALDDAQIMDAIKEAMPWRREPQLYDLLTYEKSPPLFPQATYDVPTARATALVRAIEQRIRADLASPPDHGGGDGWQSIETAPKNRKVLAAYRNPLGNWRIVTACYHTELPWSDDAGWESESEFAPEAWYEESDSQDIILPTASLPTHWQPLPAPPALPTQESEDGR